MSGTGYKILGFLVWKGVKSYVRLRFPVATSRRGVAGVALVLACAAGAVLAQRRGGSSTG